MRRIFWTTFTGLMVLLEVFFAVTTYPHTQHDLPIPWPWWLYVAGAVFFAGLSVSTWRQP